MLSVVPFSMPARITLERIWPRKISDRGVRLNSVRRVTTLLLLLLTTSYKRKELYFVIALYG